MHSVMYIRINNIGIIDIIMLYPFDGAIEVAYDDSVFLRPWNYVYNGHSFIPIPSDD